ncbi:hypothetical protein [Alkalihalobacterium sp. APHAB7]|uniref:hypothetical protein n=1 Tax=Alkalihalobacterium sp. APHAB7 TaxID=3402081 RepID=UPI003AAA6931
MKKFFFVFLTIFFIGPFTSKVDALFTSEASFTAKPIYTASTSNILDYRIHDIVYEEGGHVSAQLTLTNKVDSQIPIMLEGNDTSFSKTNFNLAPNSIEKIEVTLLVPEGKSEQVDSTFELIGFTGGYINEHLTLKYTESKLIYPEDTLEVPEQENTDKEDLSVEGIEDKQISSEGNEEDDSSNESEDISQTIEGTSTTREQEIDELDSEENMDDAEVVKAASQGDNLEQEVHIDCFERSLYTELTEGEKEQEDLKEPQMIETDQVQLEEKGIKCNNKNSIKEMPVESETPKAIAVRDSEKSEREEVEEDTSEGDNIILDKQGMDQVNKEYEEDNT